MYLGEIVRCILCELTQRNLLFEGKSSEQLLTPKLFQTAYISAIENDTREEYFYTSQVMAELNLKHVTKLDFDIVKLVCYNIGCTHLKC